MKDNRTKNTPVTTDTAEAEEREAVTDLGKFKDVKALLEAYQALEAEFTRRSQKLKELEASKEQEAPARRAQTDRVQTEGKPSSEGQTSEEESDKKVSTENGETPEVGKEEENVAPRTALPEGASPLPALPQKAVTEEALPKKAVTEEALPEKAVTEEALRQTALPELSAQGDLGQAHADAAIAQAPSAEATNSNGGGAVGVTLSELSQQMKNAVIEEYLTAVLAKRGVPFVTGGGAVSAAKRTPKTVSEAGALANKLFKNKEEK